jgi:hypothetical protein
VVTEKGKSPMSSKVERYSVPALERGLAILQVLSSGRRRMTIRELAVSVGVPASSAARLIRALAGSGFLMSNANGAWMPGPSVMSVSTNYLNSLPVPPQAERILQALCDRTGTSAQLLIRDCDDAVVIAQAIPATAEPQCIASRVGARFSGVGQADLSVQLTAPSADKGIQCQTTAFYTFVAPMGATPEAHEALTMTSIRHAPRDQLARRRFSILAVPAHRTQANSWSLAIGILCEPSATVLNSYEIRSIASAAHQLEVALGLSDQRTPSHQGTKPVWPSDEIRPLSNK